MLPDPTHDRERPAANQTLSNVTDSDSHDLTPHALSAAAIAHCHAVLVSTPSGRWSRRLYLSLHSADRAMQRARDRGQVAQCVLVELVPVPGVPVIVVGGDEL